MSTKKIQIFIIALLCVLNAYSFLHTDGRKILDNNGNEIVLKGFGLGGWLVREGYMLQIEQGADWPLAHSEIESAAVELIGEEDTEEFFRLWEENFITEQDIKLIAQWGGNSIRLPVNAKRLQPWEGQPDKPPYNYTEEGFYMIDSCLSWCVMHDIWVILDLHCVPGGQTDDHIADPIIKGHAGLWEHPDIYWPRTVELWQKIAERYKDNETVAGYDILNEPGLEDYDLAGTLTDSLRHLSEQIVTAIRSVDANHILFIEGIRWSSDFTDMTPPWDSNMVYTFHKYWDNTDQASIQHFLDIRNSYNVPIFNGETGENTNEWASEMVALMDNNNIGWNWWTTKKLDNDTEPFTWPVNAGYRKILDYWYGLGDKPNAEEAKEALFELALNSNITNGKCELLPEVLIALGLDTTTTAVDENTIVKKHNTLITNLVLTRLNSGSVKISFSTAKPVLARLAIYNIKGKLQKVLLNNRISAGLHEVIWDKTNEQGVVVSSGVYVCKFTAGRRVSDYNLISVLK